MKMFAALAFLTLVGSASASDLLLVGLLERVFDSITPCSETKATECTNENKNCAVEIISIVAGETEEICTTCINGTIPDFDDFELSCIDIDDDAYTKFQQKFNGTYYRFEPTGATGEDRKSIFHTRAQEVSEQNSRTPLPSYFLAINQFADWSKEEFAEINGHSHHPFDILPFKTFDNRRLEVLPTSIDWVEKGAVTSVKNQGHCGCCWSVSTAGVMEGAAAISSNFSYLQDISFQQLISCDYGRSKNFGCQGGNVGVALSYAEGTDGNTIGGMTGLDEYPFTDKRGQTTKSCSVTDDTLDVVAYDAEYIVSMNSDDTGADRLQKFKAALAEQPVAMLIDATCLQPYRSGIMTLADMKPNCLCSSWTCIDHAILMVGYDDNSNPPHFKIKNSWGTGWGEDGYFRVAQDVSSGQDWGLMGILCEGYVTNASNETASHHSGAHGTYEAWNAGTLANALTWVVVTLSISFF
uniref:Peptidase C1A papain C-terminal domain-containing protein n=1 Tax=Attheya septentrionalis TaxID=420275 RepID=A0A7S2ULQ6_9STRA|mmetsp:Transcript_28387/g.51739  ORF Transcript_28387/g.51739 Transcript_28387/m.51739 type:complete len:468 (+) Transcript_28387:135-1538(+)